MKISFNDKSLQTTFEYPSEDSLVQEAAAEEEEEEQQEEPEEEPLDGSVEKSFKFFLPRATFVGSKTPENPLLPDGSSCEYSLPLGWGCGHAQAVPLILTFGPAGLSSYTPKYSLAFSKWQEQTLELAPRQVEPPLKEVMVSGAGQGWGLCLKKLG